MKKEMSFWDALAWVALVGIVIWLILKVTGIINTSPILEYAPYFGVTYLLGWNVHKLESISKKVDSLEKFKDAPVKEINSIKTNCVLNHSKKKK